MNPEIKLNDIVWIRQWNSIKQVKVFAIRTITDESLMGKIVEVMYRVAEIGYNPIIVDGFVQNVFATKDELIKSMQG